MALRWGRGVSVVLARGDEQAEGACEESEMIHKEVLLADDDGRAGNDGWFLRAAAGAEG